MYAVGVLSNRVVRCSIRFYHKKNTKKLLEFLAEMPKAHTSRITDAQRQRQTITKKSDRYPPSTVYLQVLGSGAKGAPNTLYLFTDQKRYLFNCGECTQRLAHEHKVKLSRLDHIFITGKSWRNIGGLPGLSLTLQDVGVPNITLHGPEGLDELYNATKRFVIMKEMNVTMAKCTPSEDFEDNALNIKYVLLGPHDRLLNKDPKPTYRKTKFDSCDKDFEEFAHDDTDYYKRSTDSKGKNKERPKTKQPVATDSQKKKTEKVLHDLQKKSNCTVAYICTLKHRMGTLDLAKCVERGVKPGPLLGQLKNGQDVVLPDGTLVLSRDVKTPDDPGPVFIVMEVPALSYLKESEFLAHFDNGVNPPENIPTLVVHYTPPSVLNHPTYREFMLKFGPTTRHLVLNSQNMCLGSEAVHRTQHKLHLLDADIFPMLRDASVPAVWNSHPPPSNDSPGRRGLADLKNKKSNGKKRTSTVTLYHRSERVNIDWKIALAQFQNIINLEGFKGDGHASKEEEGSTVELISGRTLTIFHLRPKRQLDRSAEPKLHIQDYIQETMDVDGFVSSLEQFHRMVDNVRYAKNDCNKEYPKVVFLGTGSCIPSKTRNTSGIALQLDENRSMLLDCGEGTYGQLVRFFGPKKVNAFLKTIKAIYVSHLHADHHIGLIGVLQARREAFEAAGEAATPALLLAPGQIITWLTMYDQQFERIKADFSLIPNQNLMEDETSHSTDMSAAALASIGVASIRTCLVSHCPNAFGVAIQVDATHKLTYSGDTIPCDALVALGENSTLLIHEATMEDELSEEARTKMHSTTSQAIDIGRQMNARYTLLTHFSQRYARLPRLNSQILNDNKSVGIAFDNMQITMSDLELLPHMYAPLQLMFAEHCVEMELKAAQRAKQKDRRERRRSPSKIPISDKASPTKTRPVYLRSRKASPCCRPIPSAPVPHASYRESNASRLRQELKGMTITGIVRNNQRAHSSPLRGSSPMRGSTCSSPTRSTTSECLSPKKRDSDRTLELLSTPRTMSDTSSASRDTDRCKVTASAPCGYLVDSVLPARSKTLNSVNQSPAPSERETSIKKGSNSQTGVRSNIANGYGKPLVTPLNKRLAIRRDFTLQNPIPNGTMTSGKSPIVCRSKSPAKSWKVENRAPFTTSPAIGHTAKSRLLTLKVDVIASILLHIILWRFAHIASFYIKTWPSGVAIIALGVLFWTAIKETPSGNSLRASNTTPNVRHERLTGSVSATPKSKRPSSSSIQRPSKSPSKSEKNFEKIPGKTKQTPASKFKQPMTELKKPIDCPSPPRVSKIPTSLRNPSTEKLKQQFCRDTPVFAAGRPSSTNHSTKSFKPQLEDIKSSYLLLSKNALEMSKTTVENEQQTTLYNYFNASRKYKWTRPIFTREKVTNPPPKRKVIDDITRKEQLEEIKRKFQSRSFFVNSKYDKIEGLNWISWK